MHWSLFIVRHSLSVFLCFVIFLGGFPFISMPEKFFFKNFGKLKKVCLSSNWCQGSVYGPHSFRLFNPPDPWDKIMSCVLRRNPRRTDPLLVFAAVKKKAPSPRGTMVQKFPMHAYSLHAVPRMRLHSSLSVVAHLICRLVCFFFNAELVFLRPCLFRRLVRHFIFLSHYFEG